jgi:formylglycine-generating enzyme required for sulfatase activity
MPPRTFGPLGTTRYAVNGVAFDTICVPPGRFLDGEGLGKRTLLNSRPFEIGVTLVTRALWRAVTGTSPSRLGDDDLPVEQVSWDDVQVFLRQLDVLGLRGFRLPTEAEWAWAAQCGAPTSWAGADRVEVVAKAYQASAAPVGDLRPSAAGAFDFSGNLWELQQDVWSASLVAGVDMKGPVSGPARAQRGGSWFEGVRYAQVANRSSSRPDDYFDDVGVRLLRTTP